MCNVWFKFGVVHTPLGGPGDFTSLLRYTRNISLRYVKWNLIHEEYFTSIFNVKCPVGRDFTRNIEKSENIARGVCTTPNLNHTLLNVHPTRREKCCKIAREKKCVFDDFFWNRSEFYGESDSEVGFVKQKIEMCWNLKFRQKIVLDACWVGRWVLKKRYVPSTFRCWIDSRGWFQYLGVAWGRSEKSELANFERL